MGFPVLGCAYGEDSIFNAPLVAYEYGGNFLLASRLVFHSTLVTLSAGTCCA